MIDGHNGWGRLECRPQQHHGQDAENFAPERITMDLDSQEEDINIVAAEEEVSKWIYCQIQCTVIFRTAPTATLTPTSRGASARASSTSASTMTSAPGSVLSISYIDGVD